MTYDASNRKDIRRAEKEARANELARVDYLKAAMSVPQGRHWFYDLLEACHLFADPFTGVALTEAYLKGERNVGLRIFADIITHCPDDYISMMKEANARRITAYVRDSSAAEQSGSSNLGRDAEGSDLDDTDATDTGDSTQ
jgi:hypothetical protein